MHTIAKLWSTVARRSFCTYLSPSALGRESAGAAHEQSFAGRQEHFDIVMTVVHGLTLVQTQLHLIVGGRPRCRFDFFQIVQVQPVQVVSVGKKKN